MLSTVDTRQNNLFPPVGYTGVTRIVCLEKLIIFQSVELLRSLDIIRIFRQKQPTLKVIETETFIRQLYGTLTAHFVHEFLRITYISRSHMTSATTITYDINGIFRSLVEVRRFVRSPADSRIKSSVCLSVRLLRFT